MGILFGVRSGNSALVGLFGHKIELVAGESDDDVFVGLTLQFLYPRLGLVKGCLIVVSGSSSELWANRRTA